MKISFMGATEQVTGSCHLVELENNKLLIDCGLVQGGDDADLQNAQPFAFQAGQIDALVLSHAHLDHSGRIPLLIEQGFRGQIYAHPATIDLCSVLLQDAGYLNERGAFWENKKRQRKGMELVQPLYTRKQATAAMQYFTPLDYATPHSIAPGVELTFHDAGHILGSCIIELKLSENKHSKRLVYSGDLGHSGAPILNPPSQLNQADMVVMESTYGDRLHRDWQSTWDEIGSIIRCAQSDRGNILIPAFTVGRTQELLYCFNKYFDEWNLGQWKIFLDSPMAIETTEIYSKYASLYNADTQSTLKSSGNPFNLPNLYMTASTDESMALNRIQSGAIIIAGSGMCNGGRIKHHLKHNLWRHQSHVMIVGFQARNTPGRMLVDGAKWLSLWGESIRVNAQIHTPGGLSAHADQQGLMQWYGEFENHPPLVLVHGEPTAQQALAAMVQSRFNTQAVIARNNQTLEL